MCRDAGDDDILVKVDCDTALLDGGWLRWMEQRRWCQMYASGSLVDGEWMIYGCLYALRGRVARRLLRDMDWENMDALAPEDWTIGRAALASFPAALARIDEPWSQRTPWSSWTAWCWYSLTASPERYASRFAVVTTGNPRLDTQPASERARVMAPAGRCQGEDDPGGCLQRGRRGGGLGRPAGRLQGRCNGVAMTML